MNLQDELSVKKALAEYNFGLNVKKSLLKLIKEVYNRGYEDGLEELERRSPQSKII